MRAEAEIPNVGEEQTQGRIERYGQYRGDDHREVLGVGQRFEQAAFLRFESQHGQERNGYHQQREEARPRDHLHRFNDHGAVVSLAPVALPFLQPLVGLLDHDDRGVHHGSDGDGDATERHDVRAEPHGAHRDKGDEDRHRDRDDWNRRAGEVPEEDENHQRHYRDFLHQRVFQAVDGSLDQIRAVVGRDHLHARGEARLDLAQLVLDAADNREGVFALSHNDDSGDGVARAVPVGHAAPQIGTEDHLSDVFDAHRYARWRRRERYFGNVVLAPRVAAAAHHVLCAGQLQQAPAHVAVAAANGLDDSCNWDVVGLQLPGIDVHLVLAHEAAEWRHLGHAGHGPELVAQKPVLKRTEIGQAVFARSIHQHVLKDPTHARGVGAELARSPAWKFRLHRREVFERARARPVNVGAIVEDHVHERVAEIGVAADSLYPRCTEHRGHDRIGDLIFDDVRAAVPLRVDDDLCVAQVGDGVERHVAHGPPARDGGEADQGEHQEAVPRRELDDPVNHNGAPAPLRTLPCPTATGFRNPSERCPKSRCAHLA